MGFERRDFIKLLVGGAAGTMFTPLPWKTIDDISIWTQNWGWIPRVSKRGEWTGVPALCKLCSSTCALNIQTVHNQPVTATGNPDHLLNQGGVCPIGAATVRLLHSPSRVKSPMRRVGNGFEPVSWDEAKKIMAEQLGKAKSNVALVSGDESGSGTEVMTGFVKQLGSDNAFLMPSEHQSAMTAWNGVLGGSGQVGYDLENADYVLMIGADVLGSWGTTVRNKKIFARNKDKSSYVYVGPVRNGTAAVSHKWVPSFPAKQAAIALGIAYHLFQEGVVADNAPGLEGFRSFVLENYSPKNVENQVGISAAELGRLSRELVRAKRPLVLVGSEFGQGLGGFDLAAGLSLNVLLGRVNRPGGMMLLPMADPVVENAPAADELASRDLLAYLDRIGKKEVRTPDVLMVYDANPAYGLPHSERVSKLLEGIPFIVTFSTFMDETAAMADLILPSPFCLERYEDAYTPYGLGQALYTAAAPVISPLFDTKSAPDFILDLAADMGIDLGFGSIVEVMQAKAEALGADWDELIGGQAWSGKATVALDTESLWQRPFTGMIRKGPNANFYVALAPMNLTYVGSEKLATPGDLLTIIREDELQGGEFFVRVNSATASKYGIRSGDRIKLTSPVGEISALVDLDEGVMSDVVAVPMWFGRTAWDYNSRDKGENVFDLMATEQEPVTGMTVFADTRVKINMV
jgi:menaquinone reductase, molybdopterin-binding-like subunit